MESEFPTLTIFFQTMDRIGHALDAAETLLTLPEAVWRLHVLDCGVE